MAESSKAVFLSYASQDSEAARRICGALRAAGIEVWFDQSELRGGDAWDQKIRRQIHDCALFVPIVSANTASRLEGYFRLEWALADQRTQMIARNKAFIVPVCVDATPEAGTDVPESFVRVQWTRLPGGGTPSSFCRRVVALLAGAEERRSAPVDAEPALPVAPRRSLFPWIAAAVTLAIALAAVVLRPWQALTPKRAAAPLASPVAGKAPAAATEKSIAVLPFVDMSEKHDQEYFSDGLAEELIDRLVHSRDLRVIARTSSFQFKGKNEDMRTIASKLGVANLLEGSVRKSGKALRITAQLIRASDGSHLWSQTYQRDVADIFKLQDEIAGTVARALQAALSESDGTSVDRESNSEAYNLLLQANYTWNRGEKGDNERAVQLYKQAVKLDPSYSLAWANLARVYAWQGNVGEIPTLEAVAKARDAAGHALAIDPDSVRAHYVLGNVFYLIAADWPAAELEFNKVIALDPYGDDAFFSQDNILTIKGFKTTQFDDLIKHAATRLVRNPLDTAYISFMAVVEYWAGHLRQSADYSRKLLELNPTFAGYQAFYGLTLLLMGQNEEAIGAAEKESDDESKLFAQACIFWQTGRRADSDAAVDKIETRFANVNAADIAEVRAFRGERDAAFAWLERAYRQRKGSLGSLKVDPLFTSLRDDSRYRTLLRKMNLPE